MKKKNILSRLFSVFAQNAAIPAADPEVLALPEKTLTTDIYLTAGDEKDPLRHTFEWATAEKKDNGLMDIKRESRITMIWYPAGPATLAGREYWFRPPKDEKNLTLRQALKKLEEISLVLEGRADSNAYWEHKPVVIRPATETDQQVPYRQVVEALSSVPRP